MGEIADVRVDPLTGNRCIVAPRWGTPKQALAGSEPLRLPTGSTPCPFCPETMESRPLTQDRELISTRRDRFGGLVSYATANRWPMTGDPDAHELVIVNRDHVGHFGELDHDAAESAWSLVLERAEYQRGRGRFPLVFLNHGALAGSSQPHPHVQVLGLPVPDEASVRESSRISDACDLCRSPSPDRLVLDGEYRIMVPFAPRLEYEQLVIPHLHDTPLDPALLAGAVRLAVEGLWRTIGPVAYNLLVHDNGHPHVHVLPRLSGGQDGGAGMSGMTTILTTPEEAARQLGTCLASLTLAPKARHTELVA